MKDIKLEEIKNQVAREKLFASWDLISDVYVVEYWPIVCERYARECCKATLEKAAKNAKYKAIPDPTQDDPETYNIEIDKSSITNPDNICIL